MTEEDKPGRSHAPHRPQKIEVRDCYICRLARGDPGVKTGQHRRARAYYLGCVRLMRTR